MDILSSKANGILTLEFNRPERKNAITTVMYQAMADAINEAGQDASVRVILITGKPEIFTAGNDLDDFLKTAKPTDAGAFTDRPVFQFIGTTMLMHCDLVYAADSAKFSVPFAQLGLCPEFGSSALLPQIAGHARAAEKLMLGEPFLAQEAYDMGLVSKVLPAADVLAYAQGQAAKLAALPATSIRNTKRLMNAGRPGDIQAVIETEGQLFGQMLLAPEAKEAFTAFFEKRKPDFSKFN
jgi:enoyl-CoA hydratase/carnithine racemase